VALNADKIDQLGEKFFNLPPAQRRVVVPFILALLGVAYWYFFYAPAKRDLELVRAQQMDMQRKLNEARAVVANLPGFEEELQKLEDQFQQALRQLPNSKELPILLTDISTLGKDAGLDFRAFRPQAEMARGFYAEVPIEVEFTGTFHEIAHFFEKIARLPRIVTVGDVNVKIDSEGALDTHLRVTGNVTTFRFVEGAGEAMETAPKAGRPAAGASRASNPRRPVEEGV